MIRRLRPTDFDIVEETDAPREDILSRLNLGTLKIGRNLYVNVTNGQFDVSVMTAFQLQKATFKGHSVSLEKFDLENDRNRLETCSEIENVLTDESRHAIQCFGYVAKHENLILRCSESTIMRVNEIMESNDFINRWYTQIAVHASTLRGKFIEDMWNASDFFAQRNYFLQVDLSGVHLASSYNFKIGDLSQIKPLTADNDFKEVLNELDDIFEDTFFWSMQKANITYRRAILHYRHSVNIYGRPPPQSFSYATFYEDIRRFLDQRHGNEEPVLWGLIWEPRNFPQQYRFLDCKLKNARDAVEDSLEELRQAIFNDLARSFYLTDNDSDSDPSEGTETTKSWDSDDEENEKEEEDEWDDE